MKEIIIIGTIHLDWTPKEELEHTLSELNPDKVFVELSPEELKRPREDSIRDEMFVAYDWAIAHQLPVYVFDIEQSGLKQGITGKEPEFLAHELKSKELLKNYSWKDLNREEPWKISEISKIEEEIKEKYFDEERSKQREIKMCQNIQNELIDGRNVIVTGAGHLTFFKKQFPEAVLPFRS